jgi:hypothetical protein
MTARFGEAVIGGGLSTGRVTTDNCGVLMDSPDSRFCHNVQPFEGATQVKFSGAYPLPLDFQVSATYQDLPGIPVAASYTASNASIAPSLGRNLSAGANANATITLIEPNTVFEGRIRQLDVRLSRTFTAGRAKVATSLDLFNALNASPILSINTTYGGKWLAPNQILAGRTMKVGATLSF